MLNFLDELESRGSGLTALDFFGSAWRSEKVYKFFYNPLHFLGISREFPTSSFYFRTLKERLLTVFNTLDGTMRQNQSDPFVINLEPGLLDYLFVLPIIFYFILWITNKQIPEISESLFEMPWWAKLLSIVPLLIIGITLMVLGLVKRLIAALLTLTVGLLFVSIVHLVMKWRESRQLAKLNELPLTVVHDDIPVTKRFADHVLSSGQLLRLTVYLNKIDNFPSYRTIPGLQYSNYEVLVEFERVMNLAFPFHPIVICSLNSSPHPESFPIPFANTPEQFLTSLLSINYHGLTESIQYSANDPAKECEFKDDAMRSLFPRTYRSRNHPGERAEPEPQPQPDRIRITYPTLSMIKEICQFASVLPHRQFEALSRPISYFFAAVHKHDDMYRFFASKRNALQAAEEGSAANENEISDIEVQKQCGYLPELPKEILYVIALDVLEGYMPSMELNILTRMIDRIWEQAMVMEKINGGQSWNAMIAPIEINHQELQQVPFQM